MSESLDTLKKSSRLMGVGVTILMIIFAIAVALLVFLMIFEILYPSFTLHVAGYVYENAVSGQVLTRQAVAVSNYVFVLIVLYYVRRLFMSTYKNNTPFANEGVNSLAYIAAALFAFTLAVPAISILASYAFGVWPDQIMDLNPYLLFAAVLSGFLFLIFRYGAELQTESDETL